MHPLAQRERFAFQPILVGVVLFFSTLMGTVAPLAYVYVYLRQGKVAFFNACLVSLIGVAAIYHFGVEWFFQLLQNNPRLELFVTLPGVHLLASFPKISVQCFGIGYFALNVGVAYVIAYNLIFPQQIYLRSLRAVLLIYLLVLLGLALLILPHSTQFLQHSQDAVQGFVRNLLVEIERSAEVDSVLAIYLKNALRLWAQNYLYFLPVMFLFSISFIYVLNLVVAKRIFFPFRPQLLLIPLTEFRLPFYFTWIAITSLGLLLCNAKFLHQMSLTFLGLNLLLGVLLIYFYQGLSVFVAILDLKNIRGLWRIAIYIVTIYMFFSTGVLFTLLGFFDSWLDLRRRLKPSV